MGHGNCLCVGKKSEMAYMFIKRSWILLGDSLALELTLRWWPRLLLCSLKESNFSFSFPDDSDWRMAARLLPLGRSYSVGEGSSRGAEMATTGMGSSRFTSGSEWMFMSMAQGGSSGHGELAQECAAVKRGGGKAA